MKSFKPLLMALYGAGVAVSGYKRAAFSLPSTLLLAAATFKIARVVVHDDIGTWIREPVAEAHPDFEELVTCTRCVGVWSAGLLVVGNIRFPRLVRPLTVALAVAGINDVLQAVFVCVTNTANRSGG